MQYWENGELWAKGNFRNGKQEGAWVQYHEMGSHWESDTVYKMFTGNFKNGLEEGAWVGYNEDGTVNKEYTGTYKNGKRISD